MRERTNVMGDREGDGKEQRTAVCYRHCLLLATTMSKPTSTSSLLSLPPELIVRILACLTLSDLVSCRRACKCLNAIIKTTTLLQYLIETQVAGVEDNPASSLALVDRLRLLRARETAWHHLQSSRTTPIEVKHFPSSIYDLTGGVFLLGESLRWTFGAWRSTDSLRFVRLPAVADSADSHSNVSRQDSPWSRIELKGNIMDVGLAVQEHDLIAVVTFTYPPLDATEPLAAVDLHLLKISTGAYHPAASQPVIHVSDLSIIPGQCGVSIEIVGDTLGILVYLRFLTNTPGSAIFHTYDWKSGKQKQFRNASARHYNSFTFLSPDAIVLPNLTENTLELCPLTGASPHSDGTSPVPLATACSLALPQLTFGSTLLQMWCRSEPNPVCETTRFTDRDQAPFRPDPADAIMIFNPFMQDWQHQLHSYSLIVHRSTLLKMLYNPPPVPSHLLPVHFMPTPVGMASEGDAEASSSKVPWKAWGPSVCRWFDAHDLVTRWITTTCGQRYVTITRRTPARIRVLDFNQLSIRRLMHEKRHVMVENHTSEPETPCTPHYVDPETQAGVYFVLGAENLSSEVFEEEVTSALPYMATTTFQVYEYESVLIDEERLIGLKLDEMRSNIDQLVVHSIGPQLSRLESNSLSGF
ncbi:hypothetical protein AcV7_003637 [Taiwanofungus camphoratus]|nr:hypothetical protein AcV7_003637 [Antrodia cinnamomea]